MRVGVHVRAGGKSRWDQIHLLPGNHILVDELASKTRLGKEEIPARGALKNLRRLRFVMGEHSSIPTLFASGRESHGGWFRRRSWRPSLSACAGAGRSG